MRTRVVAIALTCLIGLSSSWSAASSNPELRANSDAEHPLSWTGVAALAPAGQAGRTFEPVSSAVGSAPFEFTVNIAPYRTARAAVRVHWSTPDELSLEVIDAFGAVIGSTNGDVGTDQVLSFNAQDQMEYSIQVLNKAGSIATYEGSVWVTRLSGTDTGTPRILKYTKPNVCNDIGTFSQPAAPCYFRVPVPVNIVFVGFDQSEVDSHWINSGTTGSAMRSTLPRTDDIRAPLIKPIVADESNLGGLGVITREGGYTVRQQVATIPGSSISFLPYGYQYQFRTIVTSESYTRRFFAQAKALTTSGDYAHPQDRAYLESYNARVSALRQAHPVLPNSPVDFIDAMKLEDWVAKNPPVRDISFDLSKPANGYTFFIIDSYRPSFAGQYFNLSHYHNFRVMNSLTVDPDTGAQRGFDWGRVWGGRYRFLMLDIGAAPNSFEGSTQAHGSSERTAFDGDSSLIDPPIWEYTGCQGPVDCSDLLPLLYQRLGEDTLSALFLRFTRAYASRPHTSGRFLLASNTWSEAAASAAQPKIKYNAAFVAARMRELLPGTPVDSVSKTKTLQATDPEEAALQDAMTHPGTRGAQADPQSVMRFIDEHRSAFAPNRPSTITIPIINVAFPGAFNWQGSDPDGGAIGTLGPDPWGVFTGVNTQSGTYEGFTASALRNLGSELGLFPPTEGVVYEVPQDVLQAQTSGTPSQSQDYFKMIDWTFATTATPMASGWFYGRYEVLDRDAITMAHTMDWLDQDLNDVSDAYAALDARGYTQVTAPVKKQILRAGTFLTKAIGYALAGFSKIAIQNARASKQEMSKALWIAIHTRRA
ncbi:MAG: hypothetical protein ACYDCC_11725 [Actinomycetota bacterium]